MLRLVLFALAVTLTLAVAQTLTSTSAPATNVATPVVRAESRAPSAVRATTTPVLGRTRSDNV
jgi:hypothetical protein